MNKEETENFLNNLGKTSKPIMIVAALRTIDVITDDQLNHFKNSQYAWQQHPIDKGEYKGLYLATWLNDKIDYIQMIVASADVRDYLLKLAE